MLEKDVQSGATAPQGEGTGTLSENVKVSIKTIDLPIDKRTVREVLEARIRDLVDNIVHVQGLLRSTSPEILNARYQELQQLMWLSNGPF